MSTVAILQARMGSSRLPGKVLHKVLDRPLLEYEIRRLQLARKIDSIIVATSVATQDDAIADLCNQLGVPCYRGSEADVLDRYYQTALSLGLNETDAIVRVTGDCPLIEATICDALITFFYINPCHFAVTSSRFAEGLDCEVFSFSALETAWKNARRPSEREHVTMHMNNNPDQYNKRVFENTANHDRYRITVDEPEDFEVVKNILEKIVPVKGINFSFTDVKDYLDSHPNIFAINSEIIRNEGLLKSLEKEK